MERVSDPFVLRLCSVFEAPASSFGARGFDPVGGMQIQTARLTAEVDRWGFRQVVVTAFRPGAPRNERLGDRATVARVGLPVRRLRQLYGVAAIPHVARLRPDIVHAHLGEDLAIPPLAKAAAARSRAPLVVTVHASMRNTMEAHNARSAFLRAVGGPLETWLLRDASAIFVLNAATARAVGERGIPQDRIHVAPLGIDVEMFERAAPRPEAMDPSRRWVVYVGRLVREKGVRDLIAALARMRTIDASLLVVGDGPDGEALRRLVASARLDHRVTFAGAVAHDSVPPFLRHAEVVVLPSWYEERGRAVLEAMAAGAPVVATRTGGIPDTVRHDHNGLLVRPRDPAVLAAAIDRMLTDRDAASVMAARGRAAARANGIEALTSTTLEAYRSVLRSGSPVSAATAP